MDGPLALLGILLAAATAVGSAELLVLTVASMLPQPRRKQGFAELRVAVIVPAHDEGAGIAEAVRSLLACSGAERGYAVFVVAHNCSDDTADVATTAGARVLVLDQPEKRGKTYALEHGMSVAAAEGFEAFAVVDADSRVDAGWLAEVRAAIGHGADAVQARYLAEVEHESPRARLQALAFSGVNVVRPRGRMRLGASVGILGNGFALSRATWESVPLEPGTIAEDLDHHVRLVRAGRRVHFLDRVAVRAPLPTGEGAARVQRARWEGGRLRIALNWLPALLADVAKGRLRSLEPAADLLLLPLGYHVALLLAVLAVPFWPTQAYGLLGLAVVALHVGVALLWTGGGLRDIRAIATAPFYLLWKLRMLGAVFGGARKDAEWVRTPREGER